MSPLTTDNRDLAQIEMELRARIDAQREAIERVKDENRHLREVNQRLLEIVERGAEPERLRCEPVLQSMAECV